jgi:hypothetical protein
VRKPREQISQCSTLPHKAEMPLLVPDDDATSWIRLPFLSSKYSKLAQDEHDSSPTIEKTGRRLNVPWQHWAVLGLSSVLFIISITVFKKTITKSLEVDRFTADGHLRPQAFWPYSMLPARSACFFESTRWVWTDCVPSTSGRGHVRRLCQLSRYRWRW